MPLEEEHTKVFFHVRNRTTREQDPEGEHLASIDDARREAVQAAREILADRVNRGDPIDDRSFEITAEDGTVVLTIPFRSFLRLD